MVDVVRWWMAVAAIFALGCGGSDGAAVEQPVVKASDAPTTEAKPVEPEPAPARPVANTDQPRVPELETEWWTDAGICPDGAKLVGKPPPRGKRVTCSLKGVPHGLEIMWIGKRIQVNTYKRGVYDGPYAVWRKDGGKIEEGLWKDGRQEGDLFQWYDDGALKVSGHYRGDRREGEWTYYRQDGDVERVVRFKAGRAVEETAGSK
jgi:hypothetical protein